MKKRLVVGAILVGMLILGSCKKTNPSCEEEKLTPAFVFDHPDTVDVGAPFNLNINYIIENSCGDFSRFEALRNGNTLEVKLITIYNGCNCVNELESKSVNYPIIFEEPANYELKVWVGEGDFESYVVVVK